MGVERVELAPGYRISRLVKGGWHLAGGHGRVDRGQAIRDMAAFVEAGITTFDCADIYTGVEEMIGEFLAGHPDLAREVQVHTKFVPDLGELRRMTPARVEAGIDRSLRRLRVERLDLVQFHWWDPEGVPGYVETGLELARLRQAGKIARVGVTNFNSRQLAALLAAGVDVVASQTQYSLLDARPEAGLLDLCRGRGIDQLCYGSLAGGFLSDHWLGRAEPSVTPANRSLVKYRLIIEEFGGWALFQALLRVLAETGRRHGRTLAQVALRWILDRPGVAAAIIGATSTRHIADNSAVFDFRLDASDRAAIDAVLARRTGPRGDCYDLERDREGRHGRIMRYDLAGG